MQSYEVKTGAESCYTQRAVGGGGGGEGQWGSGEQRVGGGGGGVRGTVSW